MAAKWWVGLVLIAPPGSLAAQGLHYEGELSVATGKYIFTERTTTWSLATGLAADAGRIEVRVTFPVYLQNTTLVTASPFGRMPTGGSSSGAVGDSGTARKRRHDGTGPMMAPGISDGTMSFQTATVEVPSSAATGMTAAVGDPIVSVIIRALRGGWGELALGGVAKVPIADTATFGTGRWDVGATASASWMVAPSIMLRLDGAYWHLGDFGGLDFHDPLSGTAAISYLGQHGWGGSVHASAATSAIEGFAAPVSVGATLTRAKARVAWSLTGTVGLTETTPDFALGLSWRVQLFR